MLKGEKLKKTFKTGILRSRTISVLNNVDIEIREGETVALIGESGSGKTTLGRVLLMLIKPDSGRVIFEGIDLTKLKRKELKKLRLKMQLIPQNPEDALNPRWKVYDSIAEPLKIHGMYKHKRVVEMAKKVGLKREQLNRYPWQLSGGELQRVVIARALIVKPKFVVCDEPTSMLDLSTQATIIRLLMKLQKEMKTSYLFITHDFELAELIADRILEINSGKVKSKN